MFVRSVMVRNAARSSVMNPEYEWVPTSDSVRELADTVCELQVQVAEMHATLNAVLDYLEVEPAPPVTKWVLQPRKGAK